jgi:hypothetical protein
MDTHDLDAPPPPTPIPSASARQEVAATTETLAPRNPTVYPIVSVFEGLRDTNPSDFGKGIGPQVIVGLLNQFANDHQERKTELQSVRTQLAQVTQDLTNSRVEVAKLTAENTALKKTRKFSHFASSGGAVLLAVGARLFAANPPAGAWLVVIIGSLFIILSWFF